MDGLGFEWDPRKAAANGAKHGGPFEEAQTAFLDGDALVIPDPDHSEQEERFVLLGASSRQRLLVVVHAHRAATGVIRLISARRATKRERQQYETGRS